MLTLDSPLNFKVLRYGVRHAAGAQKGQLCAMPFLQRQNMNVLLKLDAVFLLYYVKEPARAVSTFIILCES